MPSSTSDVASTSSRNERGRGRSRTYTGDSRRGRRDREKRLEGGTKENALPLEQVTTVGLGLDLECMQTKIRSGVADGRDDDLCAASCLQDKERTRENKLKGFNAGEDRPQSNDCERHLPSRAQFGYSSFTFPPTTRRNSASAPHLGDGGHDIEPHNPTSTQPREREREHHRDKLSRGIDALVQMHRDRDREQARLSEREHFIERKLDPEADKVKAGKDDEIDVVSELEKDWEKSKKLQQRRSHKERRKSNGLPAESPKMKALDPIIPDDSTPQLKSLQAT